MSKDLLKSAFYSNLLARRGSKHRSGGGCGWRFDVNIAVDFYSVAGSRDGANLEVKSGTHVQKQRNISCCDVSLKRGTCGWVQDESLCGDSDREPRDVAVTMVISSGDGSGTQELRLVLGVDVDRLILDADLAIRIVGFDYETDLRIKASRSRIVDKCADSEVLHVVLRRVNGPQDEPQYQCCNPQDDRGRDEHRNAASEAAAKDGPACAMALFKFASGRWRQWSCVRLVKPREVEGLWGTGVSPRETAV